MLNLSTEYLVLHLKTHLIISSSGLTDTAEKIGKLEELGAGAVVLKSLFEEQIILKLVSHFNMETIPKLMIIFSIIQKAIPWRNT